MASPRSTGSGRALFALPVALDRGRRYVLRVESSLPKSQWDYRTPELTVAADRAFRLLSVEFRATRKSGDQEFKETSVVVLPVVILAAFAVVNFGKVWPSVLALVGRSSSGLAQLGARGGGGGGGGGGASSDGGAGSLETDLPDLSWVDGASSTSKKKVKAKKFN